jgi:hypothetical protein
MQTELARAFRTGQIHADTIMSELPHIGDYLYMGLSRTFLKDRRRTLTIRRFANSIQDLDAQTLKTLMQRALQNQRANECVQTSSGEYYHIPDINQRGYETVVALIRCLAAGRDGKGLGDHFRFNRRQLRLPHRRDEEAKSVGCLDREQCGKGHGTGTWRDGLCVPTRPTARGFEGVYPHSGQRRKRGETMRGRYAQADGVAWRFPERLERVG